MKTCSECNITKSINEFHYRSKAAGTYQPYCKECRKIRDANDWQKNKGNRKQQRSEARKAFRAKFQKYKSMLACVNCGENAPECLDFHHLDPKQKDKNISNMLMSLSMRKIEEEIAKCVVLCANCHRKLHSGRITIPLSSNGRT